MLPTLIGYFPKRTQRCPAWLAAAGVRAICSVSCCISKDSDGWIDLWQHNEAWVFDREEVAWGVVPAEQRTAFDMFAWKLFPVRYEHGEEFPAPPPLVTPVPLPESFIRLGCDAVSRSCGNCFECSPLSCNLMAEEHPVNRYCLIDDTDEAFRLAREFSISEPEPGPYFVVEVWRNAADRF